MSDRPFLNVTESDAIPPRFDEPCGQVKLGGKAFTLIVTRHPPAAGVGLAVDVDTRTVRMWCNASGADLADAGAELDHRRKGGRNV